MTILNTSKKIFEIMMQSAFQNSFLFENKLKFFIYLFIFNITTSKL